MNYYVLTSAILFFVTQANSESYFKTTHKIDHDIIESQRLGGVIELVNSKQGLSLVCWDTNKNEIDTSGTCQILAVFEFSRDLNATWGPRLIGTTNQNFRYLKSTKKWKAIDVLKTDQSKSLALPEIEYRRIFKAASRGFSPSLRDELTGAEIFLEEITNSKSQNIVEQSGSNIYQKKYFGKKH